MRTGIATVPLASKEFTSNFFKVNNIPSEPKVPLRNYLLELVADSDGKESSIYLKGIEKFIQEIWGEMVKDNWRTLRVRQFIPEKLGISSLYPYKSGRKAISIQKLYKLLFLWKKYCKKNNKDVMIQWNKIYKNNFTFAVHKSSALTKLPKYLNPRLSYLLGWICGDGHIDDRWGHYLIKISEKSTNQLNYILKPLLKELFNVNAPIFRIYEGGYALQIGSKPILRFLNYVLKVKVGQIPEIIKNLDPINKKYFLLGVFDSEGNVSSSYLESRILIHQGDYAFLKQLIDLFKDLNIYFTGPYRHETKLGIWHHIQVRKKHEVLKFIKEMGTCHVDKFQKIKNLEKEIYAHGYRYGTT